MGDSDYDEFHKTPRPKKDIFDAVSWSDEESVRNFIENENVPVNATNALKRTAVHLAASHRSISILDYILNKDSSLVSATDKWGQSPLHLALQKGFTDVVEYLVEKRNADPYQPIESRFGNTAIHLAAEECRMEIMVYFVEKRKCDINVRNSLGEPPIFSAAAGKHLEMVKYLVSQGANVTLLDKNDDNILYVSAKTGDISIPKFLLDGKKIFFDIDRRDNSGQTILHRAVEHNSLEFVKYFVKRKHIALDIVDNLDRTAIYIATQLGHLDMVKYLVEKGANYKLNDLDGKTPLEIATNQEVKQYLASLKRKRRRRDAPRAYLSSARESRAPLEWSPRLVEGNIRNEGGELANTVHSQIDNMLTLLDVGFRYFNSYPRYRANKHDSVSTKTKILADNVDPMAIRAIGVEMN